MISRVSVSAAGVTSTEPSSLGVTVGAAGFTVIVRVVVPVFPAESFTVKVIVCVPTSFGCIFLTVRSKSFSLSVLVV